MVVNVPIIDYLGWQPERGLTVLARNGNDTAIPQLSGTLFKLRLRQEVKELPVYTLVVAETPLEQNPPDDVALDQ